MKTGRNKGVITVDTALCSGHSSSVKALETKLETELKPRTVTLRLFGFHGSSEGTISDHFLTYTSIPPDLRGMHLLDISSKGLVKGE